MGVIRFLLRLRNRVRYRQFATDLEDELACHRAMKAEELARESAPADRIAIDRAMGNELRRREAARDVWVPPRIDALHQDLRDAWRLVVRHPIGAFRESDAVRHDVERRQCRTGGGARTTHIAAGALFLASSGLRPVVRRFHASAPRRGGPSDRWTYAVVVLTMVLAAGAGVLPARRAAAVDPIEALRAD